MTDAARGLLQKLKNYRGEEADIALITQTLSAERVAGRQELLIELSQRYAAGGTGIELLTWCHGELAKCVRQQGGEG